MTNKVIIIGLTPQGLSLLRTLSRAGVEVEAYYNGRRNVGRYSRYGNKHWFSDMQHLRSQVCELLSKLSYRPLCYITSGEMLAWILREYRELYSVCEVVSGPRDMVEQLAHKDQMYQIAERAGLQVARYTTMDKYVPGLLQFPLIVKRNYEIPLFFKVERVADQSELNCLQSRIEPEKWKDILIQEFISIDSSQLMEISAQLFCSRGMVKGCFIAHQKRKSRKGLTAYIEELPQTNLRDQIAHLCDRFMQATSYTGFIEFEFMYSLHTQELYFIETNTRTCGEQSAMAHKYSNLPEAVLNPFDAPMLAAHPGFLCWMNILRDIRVRCEKKQFSSLLDIFKAKYDILDMRDIFPFFRQLL